MSIFDELSGKGDYKYDPVNAYTRILDDKDLFLAFKKMVRFDQIIGADIDVVLITDGFTASDIWAD